MGRQNTGTSVSSRIRSLGGNGTTAATYYVADGLGYGQRCTFAVIDGRGQWVSALDGVVAVDPATVRVWTPATATRRGGRFVTAAVHALSESMLGAPDFVGVKDLVANATTLDVSTVEASKRERLVATRKAILATLKG